MESDTKKRTRARKPITEATEFIHLPRTGERCELTGLSRSALYQLILPSAANESKPPVKSKLLKSNPGNLRGIRMIQKASLLQYLNAGEEGGQEA